MNQYIYDEINSIKELMMPTRARIRAHRVRDEYVVLVNTSPVSKFFACASMLLAKSVDSVKTHIVYCDSSAKAFISDFLKQVCPDKNENPEGYEKFFERIAIYKSSEDLIAENREFTYQKIRFCTFLDSNAACYSSLQAKTEYLAELEKMMIYANRFPTSKLVHMSQIPEIKT
ncbi:MAG: hypothetical protein ACLUFN_10080, partial [Eubacterium sp.]